MRKADKKIKPDLMSLNKLSTLRLSKEELLANKKVLEDAKKIPRKVVVLPKGYSYNYSPKNPTDFSRGRMSEI